MPLSNYDCPTFLGQKDKYLAGLSLPQLMVGIAIAFVWFLVSLTFPYSVIVRLLVVLPLTGVSMVLMFGRISGLSIPMYCLLAVQRFVSRPSYEAAGNLVVWGDDEWLEGERMKSEARKTRRRWMRLGRSDVADARKSELQAEVDRQVAEGSVAMEQWVREAARTLVKGQ